MRLRKRELRFPPKMIHDFPALRAFTKPQRDHPVRPMPPCKPKTRE